MADAKISQLPVATTPLAGTELVPVVQGGVTVQTTVEAILTGAVPSGTANGVLYLNASKVVTSGSALTFDGTNLGVGASPIGGIKAYFATQAGNNTVRLDCGPGGSFTSDLTFGAYGFGAVVGLRFEDANALLRMYADATRALAFNADGSEQMRLTSTGLGIGTSSPGAKLNVAGAAGTSVNTILANGTTTGANFWRLTNTGGDGVLGVESSSPGGIVSSSSAYATVLYTVGATPLQLGTNSSIKATLDSSGNLGLGATPSASSGSAKVFEVGSLGNGIRSGANDVYLTANAYFNTGWKYGGTGAAAIYNQISGAHQWSTAASGTAGDPISFTQAMTLDASGNLGVGETSTSGARLWVNSGATQIIANFNSTAATGGYVRFQSSGTSYGDIGTAAEVVGGSASDFGINARGARNLIFGTNNTERARITSGGSLVVGTAALATTATDGFLYVPTCAGTPTGTPTTQTGTAPIVVDTTNNKLYFYSGGQWRDAGP